MLNQTDEFFGNLSPILLLCPDMIFRLIDLWYFPASCNPIIGESWNVILHNFCAAD